MNRLWNRVRDGGDISEDETKGLDDTALLHLALPETYNSQRALERLALFQARSRVFGMSVFIRNVRNRLKKPVLSDVTVPARLVRDIALPSFCRRRVMTSDRGWARY